MTRLASHITHRWRDVEADIARFYGADATALGCRRLLVFIDGLPETAMAYGARGWDVNTELLATNTEVLHQVLVAITRLGGNKKRTKPLRFPRPWKTRKTPRQKITDLARSMRGG